MKRKNVPQRIAILIVFLLLILLVFLLVHQYMIRKPFSADLSNQTSSSKVSQSILTAQYVASDITVGWNLGNALDSCTDISLRNNGSYPTSFYETAWNNPITTKELINTVSAAGFNAIRIPVTWFYNTYELNGTLSIREEWLQRVAEVVQYALDNNMYVILNSHHDAPILWADMNDIEEVSDNAEDLWMQIAEYFKDYDYQLMFESYNELNTKDNSWEYSDEASQATNILNQLFVDTVRNTGGNNANRILICGTYLNDTDEKFLHSFVLPTDSVENRLMIQVHSYNPNYNQDINDLFIQLSMFSEVQKAPVIIGEFGSTTNYIPTDYRAKHAGNYVTRAAEYGIKCFWWDNGFEYQLFDRNNYSITQKDIIAALTNPRRFTTNDLTTYQYDKLEDYSYSSIHSDTGELTEFEYGSLTLNVNQVGLAVSPGLGYRLSLYTQDDSTGVRISSVAFYDHDYNFISYNKVSHQLFYDIVAPTSASYMRVSIFNPWGYRSIKEYQKYLEEGSLSLKVTEYQKS